MSLKESTPRDVWPTAYDLDMINAVPGPLRLRTIHALALSIAAISIAAALEWPQSRPLVALGDLAAMSVLCALAAGREWSLRCWRCISLAEMNVAVPVEMMRRSNRFEFGTLRQQPSLRRRYAAAALVILALSAAMLTQRFADLNRNQAVQSVELHHPRDDG